MSEDKQEIKPKVGDRIQFEEINNPNPAVILKEGFVRSIINETELLVAVTYENLVTDVETKDIKQILLPY
jgi:hypothetical protein